MAGNLVGRKMSMLWSRINSGILIGELITVAAKSNIGRSNMSLCPGVYKGATLNHTLQCYEWHNSRNELHNIHGPAKITPLQGGVNRVQFYVNGQEMN